MMEEGALCLAVPTVIGGRGKTMEVGIRGGVATRCILKKRDLVCIYGFLLGVGACGMAWAFTVMVLVLVAMA